jgi:hypothetical protein
VKEQTMPPEIRKLVVILEETHADGRPVAPPTRKAAAVAVIRNPLAGIDQDDLAALIEIGAALGRLLTLRAVAALGIAPGAVESYGKAAIVGEAGELEHAAAILHPQLGAPVRAVLGRGKALIPSAKKLGGIGTPIDVPLGHVDAAFVRSHFDAMEVRVTDAPKAGEILVALVLADAGRPRPRVGGLTRDQVTGEDGLRCGGINPTRREEGRRCRHAARCFASPAASPSRRRSPISPARSTRPSRSRSARSTAIRRCRPSPCPIATAGSWRWPRSTPGAACSAGRSRWSRAMMAASPATR